MNTSQKHLITHLVTTRILPRTRSDSLQEQVVTALEHLADDKLTAGDAILLESAMELVVSETPENENKEGWRDLVEALLTLRGLRKTL